MTTTGLLPWLSAVSFSLATSAFAQDLQPTMQGPAGDTLRMTCAQARALVNSAPSVILSSGPARFDRYYSNGEACALTGGRLDVAYAPTLDNRHCFIGYTCGFRPDRG
jgi:hypothetical protein